MRSPCATRCGVLPPQMAAIEKSKEAAIHSLLLDPLTAAVCSPREIQEMTLEMFDVEAEFLLGYK